MSDMKRAGYTLRSVLAGAMIGAAALAGLAAGGCASSSTKVNAFTKDDVAKARIDAALHKGMTRQELKSALEGLGFTDRWQVWRQEPPAVLARAWPPGGFWITEEVQVLRYIDLICELDHEDKLAVWGTTRGDVVYKFGSPVSPGQDPNRRFPLPPLPPPGWGPDELRFSEDQPTSLDTK